MGRRHTAAAAAAVAAALAIAGCGLGDDDKRPPQLGAKADEDDAAAKLGFPATATRNTTRVGGGDAAADAAGAANAVYPATSEASRPGAVVLVDDESWQDAVSASVLTGSPIGAPILLADGGSLPEVTRDTLERLDPKGSDLSKDAEVIRIGEGTAKPTGFKTAVIEGDDHYERAAAIDRFSTVARKRPTRNVVVVSGERAEWAMPAAAWGARSGDSILPVERDSVPAPIRRALREHERPNIYVLGSRAVVSRRAELQLRRLGRVRRIQGPTPVQNAIAFARYQRGNFGWGVSVPGYNVTIASTSRPLDAAAAAALGSHGVFAPLLLTDRSDDLPRPLEFNLQPLQPGFEDDPRDSVYTRYWILGDDDVISVSVQDRLDRLAELVPVQVQSP